MKRRKYLTIALLLILGGVLAYVFLHDRDEPTNDAAVDYPVKPKLKRPVRKNAARSELVKRIDCRNADATKDWSKCTNAVSFDNRTGKLREEIDKDCDGFIEYCIVTKFNEYGEEIGWEHYPDCGNVPRNCSEIERNEFGEMIALHSDQDCDGRWDHCQTLKRNDHGDLVEEISDKGCDGVLEGGEYHHCTSFEYDEDGRIIRERDGKCNREPENCAEIEYDHSLGIRREKWDNQCDGTVDFCIVKIYQGDPWTGDYLEGPDVFDLFSDTQCNGIWRACSVYSEDGERMQRYSEHDVCAQKYEEAVRRNRAR